MLSECGFAINDKNKKEWNFPPTIKVNISVKNDQFLVIFTIKITIFDPELTSNDLEWPETKNIALELDTE